MIANLKSARIHSIGLGKAFSSCADFSSALKTPIIELGAATKITLGLQGKYMEVGYRQPCWPGK